MRSSFVLCVFVLGLGCGRVGFDDAARGDGGAESDAPYADATSPTVREIVIGSEAIIDSSLISAFPDRNCGSCDHINGGNIEAGLVRIDLAGLPADAEIVSATLELTLNALFTPGGTIDVFAVTEEWEEGDADASSGVSNWQMRLPGTPWSVPGVVDTDTAAPFATIAPLSIEEPFALPIPQALAQAWTDTPSQNFGIVFRGKDYPQSSSGDHPHFFSTESPMISRRPRFVVSYLSAAAAM